MCCRSRQGGRARAAAAARCASRAVGAAAGSGAVRGREESARARVKRGTVASVTRVWRWLAGAATKDGEARARG